MKNKLTLLMLLFMSIAANAKFIKGSITFNDGHTETGFIKSFLEPEMFDDLFGSLAHKLNLDDKSIKFKTNENSDVRNIKIGEINEVNILNEKTNKTQKFKVLYLREIDTDGNFIDTSKKIFLPLLKEGRINLYGFTYQRNSDGKTITGTPNVAFYYQKSDEKFAFNYFEFEEKDILALFKLRQRYIYSFGKLVEDCPKLSNSFKNASSNNLSKEEKAKAKEEYKATQKALEKELKSLPKNAIYEDLTLFHKHKFNPWDRLIEQYNNNECQ